MRRTIESTEWPNVVGDETGDLTRENLRLWRARNFWRTVALFLLAVLITFVLIVFSIEVS